MGSAASAQDLASDVLESLTSRLCRGGRQDGGRTTLQVEATGSRLQSSRALSRLSLPWRKKQFNHMLRIQHNKRFPKFIIVIQKAMGKARYRALPTGFFMVADTVDTIKCGWDDPSRRTTTKEDEEEEITENGTRRFGITCKTVNIYQPRPKPLK